MFWSYTYCECWKISWRCCLMESSWDPGQGFTLIPRNCAIWKLKFQFHLYLRAILSAVCRLLFWCYWSKGMLCALNGQRWCSSSSEWCPAPLSMGCHHLRQRGVESAYRAETKQNCSCRTSLKPGANYLIPHTPLVCLQSENWPLAKQLHPQDLAFATKEPALCRERRSQSGSERWKVTGLAPSLWSQ